jgi:protein ImuB
MTLAHARALLPGLHVASADPATDARDLAALADWALRYTPWAAPWDAGADHALMLDVSGCAHLFGGEAALVADVEGRLARFGIQGRAALAETPAAAWAWARFGPRDRFNADRKTIATLPPAALRIDGETAAELERLGLRTIGDLIGLPRAPLAKRFGALVGRRLDQLLGCLDEPISPRQPVPLWQTRLAFPEPVIHRDAVVIALDRLLASLCRLLAREQQGARALTLALYRIDGTHQRIDIATGRAARAPRHLARLFAEKLDSIDAGFGIETAVLAASRVEPFSGDQLGLDRATDAVDVAEVIDRIENRLGLGRVFVAVPRESHVPERAVTAAPPAAETGPARWPADRARPLTLLPAPEPIEALAPVPDGPPLAFTWRRAARRVARAEGPERIEPEWWRAEEIAPAHRRPRDYYRVEDAAGRRYWLFREGLYDGAAAPPRWYMHGLFG